MTRRKQYDLVFSTSSRLMTAFLGAIVARQKHAVLYIDIRDIFVDTLRELLPVRWGKLAVTFFSAIERWTINQATCVNLISPGFLPYFSTRYPSRNFTLHTNGVDDLFLASKPTYQNPDISTQSKKIKIVYAGNIGTGQGLHQIIPELARRLSDRVEFHLIGAGSALDSLNNSLKREKITNVLISAPMKRDQLIRVYQQADVLFLHLNNLKAFRRVLPSKLFEYAATDKPIWGGMSGYAGRFAKKRIKNIAIFSPCDVDGAINSFRSLEFKLISRYEFVEQYSRSSIKKRMALDILGSSPIASKHLALKYARKNEE